MNIMTCQSFTKKATVILELRSTCFILSHLRLFIVEKNGGLDMVQSNVQQKINAVHKHDNESIFTLKTQIPLIVNTLKTYTPRTLYDEHGCNFESFNL